MADALDAHPRAVAAMPHRVADTAFRPPERDGMSGDGEHHRHPRPVSALAPGGNFAQAMEGAMDRMMRAMHAAAPTGDPDRDFLAMMIPHHQGAVDMAELALRHGRDPLVRQLAEGMIAGQAVEIAAMRARLEHLAAEGQRDDFPMPTGTRGPG